MEPAVVLEIRGEPRRKDKIPPNYELWIYADSRIAFGDGKVTSISQ